MANRAALSTVTGEESTPVDINGILSLHLVPQSRKWWNDLITGCYCDQRHGPLHTYQTLLAANQEPDLSCFWYKTPLDLDTVLVLEKLGSSRTWPYGFHHTLATMLDTRYPVL